MIIAQFSDTHISVEHEDGPRRLEDLKRIIGAINALDPAPDLVIHTGDLVNRGKEEEYVLACSILQNLNIPFHAVPGNRDHRSLMPHHLTRIGCRLPESGYLHHVIEDYPVRLIGLDSLSGHNNKGAFCADRRAWLQTTLDQDKRRPTALYMHHPPYDIHEAKDPFQFNRREDARLLGKVIAENRQIIRLFCGHAHRASAVTFGNVPATTVNSVATSLQKGTNTLAADRHPSFLLHFFEPDKNGFKTVHHNCE